MFWICAALVICAFLYYQRVWDTGVALGRESSSGMDLNFILAPPMGKAVALPSIRVPVKETTAADPSIYGGVGDKPHLGGFTDLDHHGVSPSAWKWMVSYLGVHSLLDGGCGRGISTSWFLFHGVDVLCVESSHDAVERTVFPDHGLIVEHDFSRGPWWPEKTYDAVWCVEFLEHVSFAGQVLSGWYASIVGCLVLLTCILSNYNCTCTQC